MANVITFVILGGLKGRNVNAISTDNANAQSDDVPCQISVKNAGSVATGTGRADDAFTLRR